MRNKTGKKALALAMALSISFNIAPLAFAEAPIVVPEEDQEAVGLQEQELETLEEIKEIKDIKELEESTKQLETKSIKTEIEDLNIVGDAKAGTLHTINARASSKNGAMYQFYVKDLNAVGPAWTIIQPYSDKTSATWTPKKGGDYLYGVHVKDKNSKEALDTHLYIPITIEGGEETVLDSLDIVGDSKVGTLHTINAKASSKNGALYQFYVKDLNAVGPAWTIIQTYSDKTSATWTPKKGGDYLYGVHVKDKNSKEALDTHLYIPVTIKGLENTVLDSMDILGNRIAGTLHTINAKGRSQNGVLYQFYIKDLKATGAAWTIIQPYSEKATATWTPEKSGEYLYGVHIKDKNSKETLDTHLYTPITIESGAETILDSMDIVGTSKVHNSHTINAQARSQNGVLYQFYIKDLKTNKWEIIQKYSEKTSATWTPKKDGDYLYGVHVKDKKSKEDLDTHLYKSITINPIPPAELESLTISGLRYENRYHTLTAKATSTNGVLYQFYIKDLKTNQWQIIQEYSERATADWRPKKAGDYWYGVHVKDKKSDKSLDAHIYNDITINPPVYYDTTIYEDTLEEALDKQVGRNKISKNGKWVNATKDEIRDYINPDKFLQFQPVGNSKAIISVEITTDGLNVRQEPNTTSTSLTTVKKGDVYVVLQDKGSWYQINAGGKKGWISNSYAKLVNDVPRDMYQFMVLSGQAGLSTAQMNGELKGQGILEGRGAAFIEGSKKYNINELYLMAHSFLETGRGKSELAKGVLVSSLTETIDGKKVTTPVPPRVVYNMYGIGAYDETALQSGSERAYKEGWFTPELAITEGAHWISNNYINNPTYKQDTLYKMKYNPATPGVHQYATDIAWALKQTRQIDIMMEIYRKIDGALLRFDIPKYR